MAIQTVRQGETEWQPAPTLDSITQLIRDLMVGKGRWRIEINGEGGRLNKIEICQDDIGRGYAHHLSPALKKKVWWKR